MQLLNLLDIKIHQIKDNLNIPKKWYYVMIKFWTFKVKDFSPLLLAKKELFGFLC